MKLRVFICAILCFLVQHVSAMDPAKRHASRRQDLVRLHAIATDTARSSQDRLNALLAAHDHLNFFFSERRTKKCFGIVYKDITWGALTVEGGTLGRVDDKLECICAVIEEMIRKIRAERDVEVIRALDASHRRLAEMLGRTR